MLFLNIPLSSSDYYRVVTMTKKTAYMLPREYSGFQTSIGYQKAGRSKRKLVIMDDLDVGDGVTLQYRMRFDGDRGTDNIDTNLIGYDGKGGHGTCLDMIFKGKSPEEKLCRYIAHSVEVGITFEQMQRAKRMLLEKAAEYEAQMAKSDAIDVRNYAVKPAYKAAVA